ncbi:MAG: class I SAM-dependent methyltransferase [Betaproteobacteria bacterium]|nr:class I SAM-dependent methyltransferase [Betaproteobacteria bacterium]
MSTTTPYDVPFEARAFQGYVSGLKAYWGNALYREVVQEANAVAAPDSAALERAMRASPAYQLYAWLERRTQQMRFHGRWGYATVLEGQRDKLDALLAAADAPPSDRLRLKDGFRIPRYVTECDTHQLSGGLWREPFHAWVLAWYQTGLSFAGSNPEVLVDWYAALLAKALARHRLAPGRILDLGCTGGRSSRAIKRALPAAEVVGADVCEPSLRLGRLRSAEEGSNVILCQQNAEQTDFDDASFDLVTSHWLLHEMPPAAIRRSFGDAYRLLRPGGLFAAYDMCLVPGGVVGDWLHTGYAARNNEPFAHTLAAMDLRADLERAGFSDVKIELSSPEHPGPDAPDALPPHRLHYMALVTALRPAALPKESRP